MCKTSSQKKTTKKLKIRKKTTKVKTKRPAGKKVTPPKPSPQQIGRVTHYFPRVKAAAILVTNGIIALGDTLLFKGYTTNFKQKISSIQINNVPIKEAKPGQEIGLLVKSRVRHHDIVYKL